MSEESEFLIEAKILHNLKDGYAQLPFENLHILKYKDKLIQLEEEDDVENCTSTEEAEDNNDEYSLEEEEDDERDLTNLTWLTELRNQTMGFVSMPLDEEPKKDNESAIAELERIQIQPSNATEIEIPFKIKTNILGQQNQRNILQVPQQKHDEPRAAKLSNQAKQPSPVERYEMFLNKIKRDLEIYQESASSFQSDVAEKPPFNYSHIIGMAMLENGRRVTLQQICSWIEKKFAFFRLRKKWNNSIRHNLSLHPCFRKIGRNKEDKGKGGYWELGVDPKKCDRKRIRNRKSSAQPNKVQKKHLQAHYIRNTKRRQQNFTSLKKFCSKNCNENLQNFSLEQNYEKLLLDEMDVQQNIDVVSTNRHNSIITSSDTCYKQTNSHVTLQPIQETIKHRIQQDGKESVSVILTKYIDHNESKKQTDDFKDFNQNCCTLAGKNNLHGDEQFSGETCQQHLHELGNINFRSENVGGDMPNIENSSPHTITSFPTINSKRQVSTEKDNYLQRQCTNNIRYSEFDNVPQSDNAIISTCVPNLSESFSTCTNESSSYQCHSLTNCTTRNSITLDISAFPAQSIQYKPNVIVEQLIQEPPLSYSALKISSDCIPTSSLSSLSSSLAVTSAVGIQNGDFANGFVNEHFRPYIDGIDEAFQYLRSIDNTRNEDILDNLLDISVSDY